MTVSVIIAKLNLDFCISYELKKSFLCQLVPFLVASSLNSVNKKVSDSCTFFCILINLKFCLKYLLIFLELSES